MAKQPRILTGQVAAITGGARGIGRATAEALIREGVRVAIGDLDLALAQQTAQELGNGTIALELDVTDRASVDAFVAGVEEQLGPIDVYINNAGIMQLGRFLEEDDRTAHRMVDINIHGVIYGSKAVLPGMVQRNRGHLVNIASQAGKAGIPGGATYCATKHAVVGLTEAIRGELHHLGADGVSTSVVMPVVVNTELGGGLPTTRAVRQIEPTDVAEAIVDALKFDRFDVNVPRSVGGINKVMGVVPRRGRESIARALKADKVLWDADPSARAGYELRAAKSEPGLEPGDAQEQLPERAGSS